MNDEKPSDPKVDGRPFNDGVGPTAQSTEGVPIGRPQLSAQQLHGDTDAELEGSSEPRAKWSAQRIITLVILLLILALVIYLKVTGVV